MAGTNPQMLIRIAADLQTLKKNLAEGKSQIEATTAGMQKMAASLDGSKLEQRAHNITAAINSVGGATKLTDAEALRHLKTLDAWIAKADRMGKEIPSDILKTRDALVRTNAEMKDMPSKLTGIKSGLTSMAGMMGITFSAGAVLAFGRALLQTADDLVRVADRTGLLTEEVQKLSHIGEQSGNTLEELTGAIGQMQNRLASGDESAVAALKQMGVSFDDLKTKNPYEQFEILAAGVAKIPNPANQAQVAMDLFGRTGIAILPTLKANMKALGDEAPIMGDKTVRALEKAGDALNLFKKTATVFAAEAYNWLGKQFDLAVAAIYRYIGTLYESVGGLLQLMAKIPGASTAWPSLAKDIKGAATQAQWFKDAATAMVLQTERVAVSARTVGPAMEVVEKATKAATKAVKEAIVLTPQQIHLNDLLSKAKVHEKAQVDFAASAWKAWENTVSTALKNVEKNSAPLKLIARDLSGLVPQVAGGGAGNMAGYTAPVAAGPGLFATMFGSPQQFGQQMASTIMGAIQGGGNVVGAAAGMVGSKVGSSIADSLTKTGGKLFNTALGGVLSSALPVIGSLIGPLAEALWGKLFGTKGRDSVKDFVAGFGGFDAFHAMLGEKLPADAERLWIALTQGVGRNNPEQAKAIIDQITAALEAQKTKTADVAAAASASAAMQTAALDAISAKYSESISKLESEYKSLSDSVAKEAEEAVMGLTEANERERMKQIEAEKAAQLLMRDTEIAAHQEMFDGMLTAGQKVDAELREIFGKSLEIPYHFTPQNAPNYGSGGGGGGSSSGGGSSRSDGSQTIVVQVDGEVLTRAVVNTAKRHGAT